MNMVFQKTRELGEALLQSEEYKRMKDQEAVAMANAEAAGTMGRYIEVKNQLEDLLMEDAPDGEQLRALSQQMDELQEHLQMVDDIQNLTQARNDFSDLIEQVNKVLRFIITGQMDDPDEDDAQGGCGGSCSGCGGGCGGHGHNHTLH